MGGRAGLTGRRKPVAPSALGRDDSSIMRGLYCGFLNEKANSLSQMFEAENHSFYIHVCMHVC